MDLERICLHVVISSFHVLIAEEMLEVVEEVQDQLIDQHHHEVVVEEETNQLIELHHHIQAINNHSLGHLHL